MTQKRNCTGCKALVGSVQSKIGSMSCDMGYPTKDGKKIFDIVVQTIPLIPCPKPLTNSNYIFAKQTMSNPQ